MRHVLIVKLRYIGDVLLATPTVRAIKAAWPDTRITMLVNAGTEEVLQHHPDIDRVLSLRKDSWVGQCQLVAELRRDPVDCVIDLTDADRSAWLSWLSGARQRIGFNDEQRWRGRLYSHVVRSSSTHRIERDLDALSALHIMAAERTPRIFLTEEEDEQASQILDLIGISAGSQFIVLQPGARYWFKAWPADRFAELADRLTERYGCRVLLGGSAQDRSEAEGIASQAVSKPEVLAGQVPLRVFGALLKRAALFVGNDSGAMHLAAAVGTPVIGLFGPSNPQEWGPRGTRVATIYKGLDCRACFHPTCYRGETNCMRQISVDEVYGTASVLIRGA